MSESVFAAHAWRYLERDIPAIPIAPGTKRPGAYDANEGWRGMSDWTRFSGRMPTELELDFWNTWPEAGIGITLGKLSRVVALDRDYDLPGGGNDALDAVIPWSPVAKKGAKGWTRFYLYSGEESRSFNAGGARVLDMLSDGRQTVMPPTIHPDGFAYRWISEETLDSLLSVTELPTLPADFAEQVERVLEPYQTEADKAPRQRQQVQRDSPERINTVMSVEAEYFRELNTLALQNLQDWVPKTIPTARPDGSGGYRCIATWRNCKNPNVGINPKGIFDFGGNYGITPIDLVMYANGLPFQRAVEVLRACVAMPVQDYIVFGNASAPATPAAPAPAPAPAPALPWQAPKPAAAIAPVPWQQPGAMPAPVHLPPSTSADAAPALPVYLQRPPGILGAITDWMVATAPKAQPELALAASLALCATVMQRQYRTDYSNYCSLYVVLVGKSTEGKEHPQKCVEDALTAAGLDNMLAGSGYTSAGAVYTALLKQPNHLAVIDEMGKLLKISRSKGNSNAEAAIDKLVEAFGKLDGVIRPPTYSGMSLTKAQREAAADGKLLIHNPAISVLGATTPATFYESLTDDLVQDGFLGRLLVVESTRPRQEMQYVDRGAVPAQIVEWLQRVGNPERAGDLAGMQVSSMAASPLPMEFSEGCQDLLRKFERELNVLKDQFEPEKLDVLLGRTAEKAMRISMIVAKAIEPGAVRIRKEHVEWAINYVRHYDLALVHAVRKHRVAGVVDAGLRKLREYVACAKKLAGDPKLANFAGILAQGGMPRQLLVKKMRMKSRELDDLIRTAVDSGAISDTDGLPMDYAGRVYFALDES